MHDGLIVIWDPFGGACPARGLKSIPSGIEKGTAHLTAVFLLSVLVCKNGSLPYFYYLGRATVLIHRQLDIAASVSVCMCNGPRTHQLADLRRWREVEDNHLSKQVKGHLDR